MTDSPGLEWTVRWWPDKAELSRVDLEKREIFWVARACPPPLHISQEGLNVFIQERSNDRVVFAYSFASDRSKCGDQLSRVPSDRIDDAMNLLLDIVHRTKLKLGE